MGKTAAWPPKLQRAHQLSEEQLVTLLRNMLTQRAVDTRGFQLNRQGKVAIAMGSEGHEAVQAGAGLAFVRGKDVLYPYYRNTGISLSCGLPIEDLFRSQFARATETTGGRSIINHCTDRERGIASISSIIAAQCTHAVGAAYAFKFRGENDSRRALHVRRRRDQRRRMARGHEFFGDSRLSRSFGCAKTTSGRSRRRSPNRCATRRSPSAPPPTASKA